MNRVILKKLGSMEQLGGIRPLTFEAGYAKGVGAFSVHNAAGLDFTLISDMCLDIYDLRYKGVSIAYISKNGLIPPLSYNALHGPFESRFAAGMLKTCGVLNAGPMSEDGLDRHEPHGNIGFAPAKNISVICGGAEEGGLLAVSGEMRETRIFGHSLSLMRTVGTYMFAKELFIEDTLVNNQCEEQEFMILYHFNFGYPFLDKGLRIVKGKGSVTARTEYAEMGIGSWNLMEEPADGMEEQCYFHENAPASDGRAHAAVINEALQLGVDISYNTDSLFRFVEWKSRMSHDYALGIEPSNNYILGRAKERENQTLQVLKGYERKNFSLRLKILDGKQEIGDYEEWLRQG